MSEDYADSSNQSFWSKIFQKTKGQLTPGKTEDAREVMARTLDSETEENQSTFSGMEKKMFRNLLDFGSKQAADVMVPRVDIISIEVNQPMSDLIRTFRKARHSRIPVYNDILDDPKGMMHVKDLLEWMITQSDGKSDKAILDSARTTASGQKLSLVEDKKELAQLEQIELSNIDLSQTIAATKLVREVLFVPPGMLALDLLHRMQARRIHMALVIDEYGGTDGLVSIEDLVEEIVGEIEDEHDADEETLIRGTLDNGLNVAGRTELEDLEEHLKLKLELSDELDEIDTVGGLVLALSNKVPSQGQIVQHKSGLEFEVVEADARKISRVIVRKTNS